MNSTEDIMGPPGGPPPLPSGPLDHGDLGPNMLAAAFGTWAIAFVFVALRIWTRAVIVRKVGASDWCIVLSLIAAAGVCVATFVQVKHGLGKHMWDIDFASHGMTMQKASWFSLLAYCFALTFSKVSICFLYLTIFTFEWVRKACWGLLILNILCGLEALISTLTFCIPLDAFWDLTVKPIYCATDAVWWVNTGLAILTSILMFLVPIPAVLPLKLPRRQKIIVVGVFAIGFFEVLVSFIRMCYLIKTKKEPMTDYTYTGAELNYWLFIEVHTCIVIACLMTLKPLLAKFAPNLLTERDPSTSHSSGMSPSDPPLTIGSRPLRNGQVRPESWMVFGSNRRSTNQGDIVLEDVENKACASYRVHQNNTYSTTRVMEPSDMKPPSSAVSQFSDRTEDLNPTAKARSIT
ncbi:hypothetical protein V8F06_004488 [Rhypophila decipiens]